MASGGARSRSGPAPDPNALRRDRKGDAGWTDLPSEGRAGDAPTWPLVDQSDRESVVWDRLWSSPQSVMWEQQRVADEVALYVRYLAEAEQSGASAAVRTLVKQYQESLGLSVDGLLKHRWRIVADEVREHRTSAPVRQSSRDRLRAVGDA